MRELGAGISDLGGAILWGEAKLLIESAAQDTSTALGAKLAGWAYPASMPDLLTLVASIGNERAAKKIMPWTLGRKTDTDKATADEIAAANAELEAGFIVAGQ